MNGMETGESENYRTRKLGNDGNDENSHKDAFKRLRQTTSRTSESNGIPAPASPVDHSYNLPLGCTQSPDEVLTQVSSRFSL